MTSTAPLVVVLAGPNGAGKSTSAARLLRGALEVEEFVNADTIALGLSAYGPESVAFAAGRVMLDRLRSLARARRDFAFETTLAGRAHGRWLGRLSAEGYRVHLIFLALPTPEVAIARVAERVKGGGHNVPEVVIRRRFTAGLHNLFAYYATVADTWQLYDNSEVAGPRLVASAEAKSEPMIVDSVVWRTLRGLLQ